MSLSNEAVDRIFTRLEGTYMAAWVRLIGTTPVTDVKTIWGHELAVFSGSRALMGRIGRASLRCIGLYPALSSTCW